MPPAGEEEVRAGGRRMQPEAGGDPGACPGPAWTATALYAVSGRLGRHLSPERELRLGVMEEGAHGPAPPGCALGADTCALEPSGNPSPHRQRRRHACREGTDVPVARPAPEKTSLVAKAELGVGAGGHRWGGALAAQVPEFWSPYHISTSEAEGPPRRPLRRSCQSRQGLCALGARATDPCPGQALTRGLHSLPGVRPGSGRRS